MREELFRFSKGEFLIMLALAGGMKCTVGVSAPELDEASFIKTLAELLNRGMLRREGDGFRPDGDGAMFYDMAGAGTVTVISMFRPEDRTAVCYNGEKRILMAEMLCDGYRVRELNAAGLEQWLFDSEAVDPPRLRDEDAGELSALLAQMEDIPEDNCFLRFEKYINGGGLLEKYELISAGGVVAQRESGSESLILCTKESLSKMIAECF